QVQGSVRTAISIHFRSDAVDLVRLNPAAQPQSGCAFTAIFFNLQHFVFTLQSEQLHIGPLVSRETNLGVGPVVRLRNSAIVRHRQGRGSLRTRLDLGRQAPHPPCPPLT